MAKFCTRCGRPLVEGQACSCVAAQQNTNSTSVGIKSTIGALWKKFKNQIGLGDPTLNDRTAFENGIKIVPDCVKPNDSEIPVKQYRIATLRNRLLGIPYTKAIGRMQVTNKRVIFRAPGRCFAGKTILQHEFAIDEIAGIETRREYVFNFWDLLGGIFCMIAGGVVGSTVVSLISDNGMRAFWAVFMTFLITCAAGALFMLVKRKWALKLLGLGSAVAPLFTFGFLMSAFSRDFWGGVLIALGVIFALVSLFTLFVHSIKPNLALVIKTKSASEAIDIRRKKKSLFGGTLNDKSDHTGYTEILPDADAELSIRELGAIINDIQKLGDFGVEKWKA